MKNPSEPASTADTAEETTTTNAQPQTPPRYGEYAPPRFGEFATSEEQRAAIAQRPAAAAQLPDTSRKKPRTADIAVTCALLLAGLIGCFFGIASVSGLPQYIQSEYALKSLGVYTPPTTLNTITIGIAVSHVVLFVLALALSVRLMMRHRLAFYVPLAAGVIAAAIFWTLIVSFIASDQLLVSTITQSAR